MAGHRERARKRYARDPEYREKILAGARVYRTARAPELYERRKKRYAQDPEFRQEILASNRASRARHRDEAAERRRKRYAQDPEYRRKILAWNKASKAAHRAEINAHLRERYASDPEFRERKLARGRGERRRKSLLATLYGMTLADYEALLARQGGVCAICRERPACRLYVDHCHATGWVRGLLCICCNFALGLFKDQPDRLRAGAAYLEAAMARGRPIR